MPCRAAPSEIRPSGRGRRSARAYGVNAGSAQRWKSDDNREYRVPPRAPSPERREVHRSGSHSSRRYAAQSDTPPPSSALHSAPGQGSAAARRRAQSARRSPPPAPETLPPGYSPPRVPPRRGSAPARARDSCVPHTANLPSECVSSSLSSAHTLPRSCFFVSLNL